MDSVGAESAQPAGSSEPPLQPAQESDVGSGGAESAQPPLQPAQESDVDSGGAESAQPAGSSEPPLNHGNSST